MERGAARAGRDTRATTPGLTPARCAARPGEAATRATPGIGLNTTAWTHENTTVLAPIPTASDPMTTVAMTGIRAIARPA